ncbi:MAG: hypothetical protein QOH53_2513, partial [Ilumatobacteraceae bacterium]
GETTSPEPSSDDATTPNEGTPPEHTSADQPAEADDHSDNINGSKTAPSSHEHPPVTGTSSERYVALGDSRPDPDVPLGTTNGSAARKGKKRRRSPGPRVPNDRDQPRDDSDGGEPGSSL